MDRSGRRGTHEAIRSVLVLSRGQRIRREILRQGIKIQDFAKDLGIDRRTLGRIFNDETPESRYIDLIEARLGLTEGTPARTAYPTLDRATNTELALEQLRRAVALDRAAGLEPADESFLDDPNLILGPPVPSDDQPGETDVGQT